MYLIIHNKYVMPAWEVSHLSCTWTTAVGRAWEERSYGIQNSRVCKIRDGEYIEWKLNGREMRSCTLGGLQKVHISAGWNPRCEDY